MPLAIIGSVKSTPAIVIGSKRSPRLYNRIKSGTSTSPSCVTTGFDPRSLNAKEKQHGGGENSLDTGPSRSSLCAFRVRTATRIRLQPHRTKRYNSPEE